MSPRLGIQGLYNFEFWNPPAFCEPVCAVAQRHFAPTADFKMRNQLQMFAVASHGRAEICFVLCRFLFYTRRCAAECPRPSACIDSRCPRYNYLNCNVSKFSYRVNLAWQMY